jgi:ABC-type phosphate transport system ATPase subunit
MTEIAAQQTQALETPLVGLEARRVSAWFGKHKVLERVSHYCAFFLAAANEPGGIVESGPTQHIFEDPQDQRTADYVHGRFG